MVVHPTGPLRTGVSCSELRGRRGHKLGGRRLLLGQGPSDFQNKGQGGKQTVALWFCGQQEWVRWLECPGTWE